MSMNMYVIATNKPQRACYGCGSTKTKTKNGIESWSLNHDLEGNVLCHNCASIYFYNPNRKRMLFRGKRLCLKFQPKTGVCNLCRAVEGIDCKRTNIHHVAYNDTNPLLNTLEVCPACHIRQHQPNSAPDNKIEARVNNEVNSEEI